MNASAQLNADVLSQIHDLEPLTALGDGGIFRRLRCPETGDPVGEICLFEGSRLIDNVVSVHILKQSMQLDAYMIAAFTRNDNCYPHLVFDTEILPDDAAFHIDLVHKQDVSTDIDYIISVMEPLSEAFDAANSNEKFRFSDATRLMKAMLNPWMASFHCQPEDLPASKDTIEAYMQHWLSLVGQKTVAAFNNVDSAQIATYDLSHRRAIYDPRVDVLWDMIAGIIGVESRDLILELLRGESTVGEG